MMMAACSSVYMRVTDYSYEDIDFSAIIIDEADPDYVLLKNAEYFAYGGIGAAGIIPEEKYAFKRIFKKENALDFFYKLEAEGNNQGKLYALCGLFYYDYGSYPYLMEKYGKSEETVEFFFGCSRGECPISELIKSDQRKAIRLKDNRDTISEWCRRHRTDSYFVDFYGGAIPEMVNSGS